MDINTKKLKKNAFRVSKVRGLTASRVRVPGGCGRYDEMIGKFTGNQTCACGFSIGFERIVMLLLERDYQIPGAQKKKAYLIEKNMPAEGMQKIIQQATKERSEGTAINIAVMKKNKKFQKEQLASEGYTEIEEFFVDKM